ncbi:hypothetical protein EAJ18_19405 [Citrobacter amalonaticus]|uniref:Tetratricopeptide repeat protein n=2 Tax=Citrobacter amalonaticus TaxID=35703 RepID=A0ABY0HQB3_CITAM|nr:hypothetical protein [Citrobacter amalonaticus]MZK87512.1 hypothetical protein [Citrobacter amalonaticus]MZK92041.1 hypothetical protein [Citrobacter amalonaticus]MZL02761.1 hypothetical protein [Citrobacter amalonaticus]MZL24123.1 hypothetical protein [Citrobacter amalonaticus]MZL41947.1 hypothetical protein [Citrobacter amalonaticus]
MVKRLLPLLMLAVLSGCTGGPTNASDEEQKEYILTQLNDYQGLIEIYRNKLSVKDNDDERYYLSQLYNKIGDYSSSNIYLAPLVEKKGSKEYLLLKTQNLLELGKENEAQAILNEMLAHDDSNGELWNLQGILLAQTGDYLKATLSFEKARGLFYDEEVVVNNLAMMAILQGDYITARNYLLPLYSRKEYKPQTAYNLAYALVKSDDYESAKKIIIDDKLSTSQPDALIASLAKLSPREHFKIEGQKNDVAVTASTSVGLNQNKPLTIPVSDMQNNIKSDDSSQLVNSGISQNCTFDKSISDAVLPFAGEIPHAKLIANVTSASIPGGDRIALYSAYPLNYSVMPKRYDNIVEIEIFNAQPMKRIYDSLLANIQKRQNIKKIEIMNNGNGNSKLQIVTNKCITTKSVSRLSVNGQYKEKVIVDINY